MDGAVFVNFGMNLLNMGTRVKINFRVEDLPEIVKRLEVKKDML